MDSLQVDRNRDPILPCPLSRAKVLAPTQTTRLVPRLLLGWLSGMAVALSLEGGAIAQSLPPTNSAQVLPTAANLLFVSPTLGNDSSGNGSQGAPLRTITQALQIAQPSTVIMLTAGTYSAESGETFPLRLKPGVTIQGDPTARGRGILIRGGGTFLSPTSASQNITILAANQAGLTGVTVTNPNPRGYGVWIESTNPTIVANTFSGSNHDGISVVGSSAPLIQGNHFVQNGANGITLFGTSQAEVRENLFERTGYGINVAQNAAPRLIDNQVTQNRSGIVVQANARPLLRGNRIENNQEDGLVAIAQAQPDLGTDSEPGNNVFQGNGEQDIDLSAARQQIAAIGNQLANRLDPLPTAPTRPAPPASPPAAPAPAAPAPAAPAPAAASAGGFGSLPRLEPAAPIAAPAPPPAAASDATPRINLVTRSAASAPPPAARPAPAAIEIPVVPPPQRQAAANPPAAIEPPQAIEIPVIPAPARSAPPQSSAPRAGQTAAPAAPAIEIPVIPAPAAPRAAPPSNLLPVPDANIPVGNIGSLPTIDVAQNPLSSRPTPNPTALGLRYRVVVEASSESEQAQVRSLAPGAFQIYANGRPMMQAGAFSDRANAEQAAAMLTNSGLQAMVQAIE